MAEELHWLLALRRDTDLIVPEPVPACDGTFIQAISDPDTPGPWHGVLFHLSLSRLNHRLPRCQAHPEVVVAYLLAADNVSGPLPIPLREVNQPVSIPRNRFSRRRARLLACI